MFEKHGRTCPASRSRSPRDPRGHDRPDRRLSVRPPTPSPMGRYGRGGRGGGRRRRDPVPRPRARHSTPPRTAGRPAGVSPRSPVPPWRSRARARADGSQEDLLHHVLPDRAAGPERPRVGECLTVTGTPAKTSKTTIAARSVTTANRRAQGRARRSRGRTWPWRVPRQGRQAAAVLPWWDPSTGDLLAEAAQADEVRLRAGLCFCERQGDCRQRIVGLHVGNAAQRPRPGGQEQEGQHSQDAEAHGHAVQVDDAV